MSTSHMPRATAAGDNRWAAQCLPSAVRIHHPDSPPGRPEPSAGPMADAVPGGAG